MERLMRNSKSPFGLERPKDPPQKDPYAHTVQRVPHYVIYLGRSACQKRWLTGNCGNKGGCNYLIEFLVFCGSLAKPESPFL